MYFMIWTIRDTARVCNFIRIEQCASPWFMITSILIQIHCPRYQSIIPQQLNKSRSVFGLFCHQTKFFLISERAPSVVHGAFWIRKYLGDATVQIITAVLSWKCKLTAALFKSRKILWELRQQLRVNCLHISNPRILHYYLHVTMEFFLCWVQLFFSNGKFWLILSTSVM